jgi:thioredoxin 1
MKEVNKDNFEQEVLKADKPVLVDFWGPQCEPCKALMPEVEKLSEKYGDKIKFVKVNTAENRRLAISQKVMGLPAIVFYKNGERVDALSGDVSPSKIEEKIQSL